MGKDGIPVAKGPLKVLLLEDNPARPELMTDALRSMQKDFEIRHWDNAWLMKSAARQVLSGARLISLDHDLQDRRTAGKRGPGCGMDVVEWLCRHRPVCPVIVHTSLPDESRAMVRALRAAGWRAEPVTAFKP